MMLCNFLVSQIPKFLHNGSYFLLASKQTRQETLLCRWFIHVLANIWVFRSTDWILRFSPGFLALYRQRKWPAGTLAIHTLRHMNVGGAVLVFKLFTTERKVHSGILIKILPCAINGTFSLREHLSHFGVTISLDAFYMSS